MKTRLALLVLIAAVALPQPAIIHAQATTPAYLSQMPSTARVRDETKGADSMDTAARQMGAFWQLLQVIQEMAGQRYYRNQLTPDEGRYIGYYRSGYSAAAQPYAHIQNSPSHPDKEKWFKMHSFYESDPGFLDELLKKFFTEEFRARYYQTTGKQPSSSRTPSVAPQTGETSARPTSPAPSSNHQQGAASLTKSAVLSVKSGFASQAGAINPLSNAALILHKESFGEFLKRKGMFQGTPGSPARLTPIGNWVNACLTGAPACKQALSEMQPNSVSEGRADANGSATLSGVPPGTYYLFVFAPFARLRVWDLRVDLKAGANSVTLDLNNAAPLEVEIARSNPPAGGTAKQPSTNQPTSQPGVQPNASLTTGADAYADQGYKYYEAKDYTKAIEAYKKALAVNPSSIRGHKGLALIYEEQKQWQQAIAARQKLLALKPDDASNLLLLADDYFNQKEYQRAISTAKQYTALRPGDAKGLFMLAVAHRAAEEFPQAVEAFRGAIRFNPEKKDLAIIYNHLGHTYVQIGKKEDALQVYRTLKPLDPVLAQKLYDFINQPTAATPQPKTSAATGAEAYIAQGDKYREAKDYAKAVDAYKKAIALEPSAYAYNNLGLAYYDMEQFSEAVASFQQAIRLKPNVALYRQNLGGAYLEMGRKEDALQVYQELLKLDQVKAKALHKEIEAWFDIESRNDKDDAVNIYLSAGLVHRETSLDGALRYFRRVIVLNYDAESVARAYLEMGNVHKAQQKNEKAAADYQQAVAFYRQTLRLKPTNADAQYHLGLAYLALGRKQEAQQVYSQLQRLDRQKAQELYAGINKSK